MTPARDEHAIDTLPRLEALLGPLSDASVHKELPYVHPAYRAMIAASRLCGAMIGNSRNTTFRRLSSRISRSTSGTLARQKPQA